MYCYKISRLAIGELSKSEGGIYVITHIIIIDPSISQRGFNIRVLLQMVQVEKHRRHYFWTLVINEGCGSAARLRYPNKPVLNVGPRI